MLMAEEQPTSLARTFFVSVYLLACLSGGVLAASEGALLPTSLTVPIALAAFVLVQERRLVRISALWANVAGLVAFGAAGFEFFGNSEEAPLLAGVHLVAYLQWILLVQQKERQHYWLILALSILQIALSAVLTTSGWFGLVLMVYLLLAMWTLSVFSLYTAELQFYGIDGAVDRTNPRSKPRPAGTLPGSTFRNGVQRDPREPWINTPLVGGVLGMTLAAMCIGFLVFLVIPRVRLGQMSAFGDLPTAGRTISGFSERVQLGDMGEILESTQIVLRARMVNEATGEALDVEEYARDLGLDEPLFRGAVLVNYERGRWQPMRNRWVGMLSFAPRQSGMVRQEYRIEPIGTNTLFAMPPVQAGAIQSGEGQIGLQFGTGGLVLTGATQNGRTEYVVYSPLRLTEGQAIQDGLPSRLVETNARQRYLEMPGEQLSRLSELARQVAAPERLPPSSESLEMRQVRAIESYLRDSGEFEYTLQLAVQDGSIDPLEDFLFNRKSGHCEYFASALVMMLRSIDVPARMITGFKGGVPSTANHYYEVQQRHAHAWVEAFVDGRWMTFDATPAAARQALLDDEQSAAWGWSRTATDYMRMVWSDYVVEMSPTRQRQSVYEPVTRSISQLIAQLGDVQSLGKNIGAAFHDMWEHPERWFSVGGGLAVGATLLCLTGFVWLIRRTWRGLAAYRKRVRSKLGPRAGRRVEFYERFARLLEGRGFRREEAQTQQEFAAAAAARLAPELTQQSLGEFPAQLAAAFYRVRFGDQPLTDREEQEIAGLLEAFEVALRPPEPNAPKAAH